MRDSSAKRVAAIVLGSSELGSAIAARLDRVGLAVVLCDHIDPACLRRGMAFTDAWYVGTASLEASQATFCASVRSIPTVLAHRGRIAATTWSWPGVAEILAPAVVIDARCTHSGSPPNLIAWARPGVLTVGATPWYAPGENAHIAIWPWARSRLERATIENGWAWDPLLQEPFRKTVRVALSGRFHTNRRIGEFVARGEPIGAVAGAAVVAPASGVLSGLVARGCRVEVGTVVVEVDTRGEPAQCFAIPEWCESVAVEIMEQVFSSEEMEFA